MSKTLHLCGERSRSHCRDLPQGMVFQVGWASQCILGLLVLKLSKNLHSVGKMTLEFYVKCFHFISIK